MHAWIDQRSLGPWLLPRNQNRPALLVDAFGPVLFAIRATQQKLARQPVQQIVECIAIRYRDQLAGSAAKHGVDQHRYMVRIPVMDVVWRELEMPLELAGIRVEGEQRGGIKVVALARTAVIVGARIARAPVDQVRRRVVGPGGPRRR